MPLEAYQKAILRLCAKVDGGGVRVAGGHALMRKGIREKGKGVGRMTRDGGDRKGKGDQRNYVHSHAHDKCKCICE